jgi:hypothetical protein
MKSVTSSGPDGAIVWRLRYGLYTIVGPCSMVYRPTIVVQLLLLEPSCSQLQRSPLPALALGSAPAKYPSARCQAPNDPYRVRRTVHTVV